MPSQIQSIGQRRAAHAWEQVKAAFADSKGFEEFADNAKKLPMRIRASGLGQSFAFLAAKQKAPGLRKAIASWCRERGLVAEAGEDAIGEKFRACSAAELRLLTAEILAYLEWVVRFADARTKVRKDGDAPGITP